MIYKEIGIVLENKELLKNAIYLISIKLPKIAKEALPGQFLEIKTGESPLLRKPISLFNVNKKEGIVSLLYRVRGKGTKNMSKLKKDGEIDIVGSLGNGFTVNLKNKRTILVGGGIGIAPLYYLGRELTKRGNKVKYILGYNCKEDSYAIDIFAKQNEVEISTMDGSLGCKGHVGSILDNFDMKKYDMIYGCGPKPMLKYLKKFGNIIPLELSLEAYMGCGLGACLSCVYKKTDGSYGRVCKDGPVFKGNEVNISE